MHVWFQNNERTSISHRGQMALDDESIDLKLTEAFNSESIRPKSLFVSIIKLVKQKGPNKVIQKY